MVGLMTSWNDRGAGNPERGEIARHPRGEQPEEGVGKTTVAFNTVRALNQRSRDVLLVDLDPHLPGFGPPSGV